MRNHALAAALLTAPLLSAPPGPEALGPFGGSAAIVAVDTNRPGTVLAATSNALLFRSINGGDTWERLRFPGELRARFHALVITPRTGVYFAGLSDDARLLAGVFRSTDGGASWTRLPGLGPTDVWSLAVWPMDPKVVAAGTAEGVFLTRDGGDHWARVSPASNEALKPVVSVAFDLVDSRILYAGTPHLPWKTEDGGQKWEPAHAGMQDDSDVFSLHVDDTRPSNLFATACTGVYRSANRGANWTKILQPLGASSRTYQITQDSINPNILLAGTANGLVRSVDRGVTWRKLSNYMSRWIALDPARAGRIYVATDEAGLLRSDDYGDSLQPVNEGFCNRRVLSVAAGEDAIYVSAIAGSASTDLFRRPIVNGGWDSLMLPPQALGAQILQILPTDSTRLYTMTPTRLLVTADAGQHWEAVRGPASSSRLTAAVLLDSGGQQILVGTEQDGIYGSDDAGESWTRARLPDPETSVRSLIRLGAKSVAALTHSGLLLSKDGFEFVPLKMPERGATVNAILAADNRLVIATQRGIAISDDDGLTWRWAGGVLKGFTVSALCGHPRPRVLFACSYGRIFGSLDNGESWMPITAENEFQSVEQLLVTPARPDTIYAVTHAQGIYQIPIGTLLAASGRP